MRLKHNPPPVAMLNQVFALVCDMDCEWNCKNKGQSSESKHWEDLFGQGDIFARSPEDNGQVIKLHGSIIFLLICIYFVILKDPYGWLVDLLNQFGAKNGFGYIQDLFEKGDLDAVSMAAILKPLGNCAGLLNQSAVNPMLTKCIEFAVNYVTSLKDKDLKNKVTLFFLATVKFILYFLSQFYSSRIWYQSLNY